MFKISKKKILYLLLVLIIVSKPVYSHSAVCPFLNVEISLQSDRLTGSAQGINPDKRLARLTDDFLGILVTSDDSIRLKILLKQVIAEVEKGDASDLVISKARYSVGVYYLLNNRQAESLSWLRGATSLREKVNVEDEIQAKGYFNMGLAYFRAGDYRRMIESTLKSLEIERKIYGDSDPRLISSFSSLVTAYLNINEYSTALRYGNEALDLIRNVDENQIPSLVVLYMNIGVCYTWLSDYSRAEMYFEQAESLYKKYELPKDVNYINLLNSLGATYYFLGKNSKSEEYFSLGIEKIRNLNSPFELNFLNSIAFIMGEAGNTEAGSRMLLSSLDQAKAFFGSDSGNYYEVLKNYAEYLRQYKIDLNKSLELFEECAAHVEKNPENVRLYNSTLLGYALALEDTGYSQEALGIIQKLLYVNTNETRKLPETENPPVDDIEPVQWSLKLLHGKYRILRGMFLKTGEEKYLLDAAATAETIIGLIEKIRVRMGEDESLILLGDRYRDIYLFAMSDYELCFRLKGDEKYLRKAFEYSEKSKVAGLLTTTRELKATQFHIPPGIAELERSLKSEISFYESRIDVESSSLNPDELLLEEWKTLVLNSTNTRDSLIRVLEKGYPDYYMIKYNSDVISPDRVPDIAGRKTNYLSYVVSDTVLHVFLKNRKYFKLATLSVDSAFLSKIGEFRELISNPGNNAKSQLSRFLETGQALYKMLIEPVKKYFISDRLLISPDNILSYIPFEAIPVRTVDYIPTRFNEVPYLFKEYRISYAYSATFLAETLANPRTGGKKLVAFAPIYTRPINVDSLLDRRQAGSAFLYDLPHAREEASYVADIARGKLYINDAARESVFKEEAGKYDIIHLAMHTVLNDQSPMYSKMLFYPENNSPDDGNLNTWEVYGVPLKARMVILSSCNTGFGKLHLGEGILSLARGFMYSGSQSVVMSIWEIEDKSGTDIVKNFYRQLMKGMSKSDALQRARIDYLSKADMLKSHPYFWSSLVIYGSNGPLYRDKTLSLTYIFLTVLILVAIVVNYRDFK